MSLWEFRRGRSMTDKERKDMNEALRRQGINPEDYREFIESKPLPISRERQIELMETVRQRHEEIAERAIKMLRERDERVHYAEGVADLAIRQRTEAEAEVERLKVILAQARNEGIEAAKRALVDYWTPGEYNSLSEALNALEALKVKE